MVAALVAYSVVVGTPELLVIQGPDVYTFLPSSPGPRRRQWQPTPVLLPGKSHGWRSLVGCSPWGLEESDMTERLHFHFSLSCIGEGNGNLSGRESSCQCMRGGFNPWVWDMPGEENGNPLHHNILAWGIPWTEEP